MANERPVLRCEDCGQILPAPGCVQWPNDRPTWTHAGPIVQVDPVALAVLRAALETPDGQ